MAGKIPADAFDVYFAMGTGRSYEALAARFGCTKKAISNRALKEDWQGRAVEIERKAQTLAAQKTAETLGDVQARHGKIIKAIQGKAIEALKSMPLDSGMDAIRALDIAVRLERGHPMVETGKSGATQTQAVVRVSMKLVSQFPIWMTVAIFRAGHWKEKAMACEQEIGSLVNRLCAWLQQVQEKAEMDPVLPFHQLALLAFMHEEDESKRKAMRDVVFQLEVEFEVYRKEVRIDLSARSQWQTRSIRGPTKPIRGARVQEYLTWQEAFGTSTRDPITFLAERLRAEGRGVEGAGMDPGEGSQLGRETL